MVNHGELVITRDVEVPLADGTVLRADVYRPVSPGPYPALLQRTPYIKDFNPGLWVVIDPVKAAGAGFAVVIQDVRGRGRSDGEFTPFVNEASDGADTVAWAARQPWCNGDVAMYGSSYMAAAAWQVAKTAPGGLAAMTSFQASSDYHEGRSYRGGAFEIGALLGISLNALGGGIAHRMVRDGRLPKAAPGQAREMVNRIAELARTEPIEELRSTLLGDIAPFFFEWAARTDPADDYWRSLSVEDAYPNIDVPVLHCSSWFDQAHVGTLRNFTGMRGNAPGGAADQQYLLMGPWAHRVPRGSTVGQLLIGERYFGAKAIFDLDRLQLTWLDKVLKGDPNPWPFAKRVRLFVMGRDTWREFDQWPPEGTVDTALHLADEGIAGWDSPTAGVDSLVHDPSEPAPTTGGAHMAPAALFAAGPVDQRAVQARDDVLTYTSDVLVEPIEVIGWVEAELWVSHDEPADYAVTLSEVFPDGRCLNVCDGYLRTPDGEAGGENPRPIQVRLGATAQQFGTGNRIRVHVTASSSPRHPVRGSGGDPRRQRVHLGADTPSRVVLPVLPSDSMDAQ